MKRSGVARRRSWVILACASACLLGLGVPASADALPSPAAVAHTTHVVKDVDSLIAVACWSTSDCLAVGDGATGGVVVPITNGVPGASIAVTGTDALRSISCATAADCVAVGNDNTDGVIVPITHGAPGGAAEVPGTTALFGVACKSAMECTVVGTDGDMGVGVIVPVAGGTAGTVQRVTGTTELRAVACSSTTTCEAVGFIYPPAPSGKAVVVPILHGVGGRVADVTTVGTLQAISCVKTSCDAAGDSPSGAQSILPITDGKIGSPVVGAQTNPDTDTTLYGLACVKAGTCEAVGQRIHQGSDTPSSGVLSPLEGAHLGPVTEISEANTLVGEACPSSTACEAVGTTGTAGVAVTLTAS